MRRGCRSRGTWHPSSRKRTPTAVLGAREQGKLRQSTSSHQSVGFRIAKVPSDDPFLCIFFRNPLALGRRNPMSRINSRAAPAEAPGGRETVTVVVRAALLRLAAKPLRSDRH